MVSRGEFLTSYTPYQAEISQGTLTTIFEFQTMICQLTGMDVANASMYDGSTAVPEAAMMAVRVTGRDRMLVSRTVHPEYREVLLTYAQHQGMPVAEFGYVARSRHARPRRSRKQDRRPKPRRSSSNRPISSASWKTSGSAAEIAHKHGALLIFVFTEAVSLGMLEPPRDADIVAGELQSFAISPSYGGPVRRHHRDQGKVHAPDARPPGRRDQGYARQSRVLPDAGHSRAAHPPREGHFEHLHQPGADRPDGHCLHDRLRQGGPARAGRAEPGQSALSGRQTAAAILRAVLQRVRRLHQWPHAGSNQRALLEKKIIGGLPLGRYYPELEDSMLLCATEMSRREKMDAVAEVFAK